MAPAKRTQANEKSPLDTPPADFPPSSLRRIQHFALTFFSDHRTGGEEEQGVYTEEMRSVFLFRCPELYYNAIDLMLIIISFYLALWVVNFTYSANKLSQPDGYRFLSLLPGALCSILLVYNVRSSYLLKVNVILSSI